MSTEILVVEDNPMTRKVVRVALQNHGFVVVDAADGATALRLFTTRRVALVLQDLLLPDMDGFELVKQLRALPGGTEVPILAFSGLISKVEEARMSAVGFDDVISKPVEPSRLLQIVRAHMPTAEPVPRRFGQGKRLVLADDDPVQRRLGVFRLQRLGFEVIPAADGLDALARAREVLPDVIISDVLMPRLDGFGLCMAVRSEPQLAGTPVVLVTNSYLESADRDLARRAGASDLVLRTPELREVLTALERCLGPRHIAEGSRPVPLDPALEQERVGRMMNQLERQVALNAGVSQRCALLSAELSVLSGISEAVATRHDIEGALRQVLAACFDAGGISVGALYLCEPGGFRVLSFGSMNGWGDAEVADLFGEVALLRQAIATQTLLTVPSPAAGVRGARLLLRAGIQSALIAPLGYKGEALGALLMVSRSSDLQSPDRVVFAQAVAGQISVALALARSFAAQEASEAAARQHAAVLGSILDGMGDGVVVVDGHGEFIHWNRAARAILRRGPEDGPLATGEHPLVRAMAGESVDHMEMQVRPGAWLSVNARPLGDEQGGRGGVAVFRDVTAEKVAQGQLMMSDRMASLGVLAAGVAHEINNPLVAVVGNLDLMATQLAAGAAPTDLAAELEQAREGAERVRRIVRDLKLFSRPEEDRRATVDVVRVLESSLRMAGNEIRHRAQVNKDYQPVPPVHANESRLGQVFLNLIMNAVQALPEGSAEDNRITVATAVDGGRVRVTISDTGAGMSAEVLERIFTPFFTTKPIGVGTGLGLSICQGLVEAMGGEITVDSAPGAGTSFHVLLPALLTPAAPEPVAAPPAARAPARRRGRILIVDDEPAITSIIHRVLGSDHEVVGMTSAVDAARHIAEGARYDLILCDLMMPVATGMDLHAELLRTAPDQAACMVFMTGGAFTPRARAFLDEVGNARLDKPFDLDTLQRLVDQRIS